MLSDLFGGVGIVYGLYDEGVWSQNMFGVCFEVHEGRTVELLFMPDGGVDFCIAKFDCELRWFEVWRFGGLSLFFWFGSRYDLYK